MKLKNLGILISIIALVLIAGCPEMPKKNTEKTQEIEEKFSGTILDITYPGREDLPENYARDSLGYYILINDGNTRTKIVYWSPTEIQQDDEWMPWGKIIGFEPTAGSSYE